MAAISGFFFFSASWSPPVRRTEVVAKLDKAIAEGRVRPT